MINKVKEIRLSVIINESAVSQSLYYYVDMTYFETLQHIVYILFSYFQRFHLKTCL
jgi:hypothetical protein